MKVIVYDPAAGPAGGLEENHGYNRKTADPHGLR